MATGTVKLGFNDAGRPLSAAEFEAADFEEGFLYELSRRSLHVSDVPKPAHLRQVSYLRKRLALFHVNHPQQIYAIAGGSDCKLVITQFDSTRHPDLAVYRTPPPEDLSELWEAWFPEMVIEVVSLGSEARDYQEKREEYLAFGVREYWIVDALKGHVTVLRRVGGRWREQVYQPGDTIHSKALPGFECECGKVIEAGQDL